MPDDEDEISFCMRVAGPDNPREFVRLRDEVPYSQVWEIFAHQVAAARMQHPD